MESATAETTLDRFLQVTGYPHGPQFVATSFQKFCESWGIQYIRTSPYSPRSNGEAERPVQTFKNTSEKRDSHTNAEIWEAAIDVLAMYR